jgi:hypothetical protein
LFPGAQGFVHPEGDGALSTWQGEAQPAGVKGRGAYDEGGPETWESLATSSKKNPAELRGAGDQFPEDAERKQVRERRCNE